MQSIAIIKQLKVLREKIIFNKGIRDCLLSTFTVSLVAQKNISDQSERSLSFRNSKFHALHDKRYKVFLNRPTLMS